MARNSSPREKTVHLSITLTPKGIQMLNRVQEKLGERSRSAAVERSIRELHQRVVGDDPDDGRKGSSVV